MRKLRRGQTDNTVLLVAVGVGVLLLAGLLVFMLMPKEDLKPIKIGKVTITYVRKDAIIEWKNAAVEKNLEEVYEEYGYVPTFEGNSLTGYDAAEDDAKGRLAEYLNAVVKRFSQLAKASLANVVKQSGEQGENVNAEVLTTEVSKMVQQIQTQAKITGAVPIVRYRLGGKYHVIIFFNPNIALKLLEDQASAIENLARKYGVQSRILFDEVNKTLKEAYKGTPLENQQ